MDGLEKCVWQAQEGLDRMENQFMISYEPDIVQIKNQFVLVRMAIEGRNKVLSRFHRRKLLSGGRMTSWGTSSPISSAGNLHLTQCTIRNSLFAFSRNAQFGSNLMVYASKSLKTYRERRFWKFLGSPKWRSVQTGDLPTKLCLLFPFQGLWQRSLMGHRWPHLHSKSYCFQRGPQNFWSRTINKGRSGSWSSFSSHWQTPTYLSQTIPIDDSLTFAIPATYFYSSTCTW